MIYKTIALADIICYTDTMFRLRLYRGKANIAVLLLPALLAGCLGCAGSEAGSTVETAKESLVISEVMSSNTALAVVELGTPDWIELTNVSDAEISLRGWQLTDDLEKKSRCALPDETLAAGESLLLYAISGEVPTVASDLMVADFSLSKDGETLYLIAPDQTLAAELVFPALPADISYARRSDGSYGYCSAPTPRTANLDADIYADAREAEQVLLNRASAFTPMTADDPIRISEILLDNRWSAADEDGDRGAWVELYNTSEDELTLAGYYLSDKAEEPLRFALPDCPIGPGERLVIYLSGKDRTDAELHANFRLSEKDGVLILTDAAANRSDVFELPAEIPENISVGRDDADGFCFFGMPTPGYENAKQFMTADMVGFFDCDGVFVSEVSAAAARGTDGNDWIELRNGSAEPIDLAGWSIADAPDGAREYLRGTIAAGEYLAVDLNDASAFRLSCSGETVFLYDAAGHMRDIFQTGALRANLTSGRPENLSADRTFFTTETKAAKNAEPNRAAPAVPTASETSLYHDAPFSLALRCATAGAEIRYTVDGSLVTADSPLYTEPITIKKNTVLRAASFREGSIESAELFLTFLFIKPHTVPVWSVAGSEEEIDTIFEDSKLSYRPEYRVQMGFYEADGTFGTAFPADMRIKGNQSSSNLYKQKSVVMHLRGAYGQSDVTYPFFGDGFDTVTALALRNSGQEAGLTRLRDAFASRVAEGLHVTTARNRLVVLYRNGSYHGLYYMTEQMNEEWIAAREGVSVSKVEIVDRMDGVLAGTGETYDAAHQMARAKNKLRSNANYDAFCEIVDVESITDSLILKTFLADVDTYNQRYWAVEGGKMQAFFYDNDMTLMQRLERKTIVVKYFRLGNAKYAGMIFHAALRKNANWRDYFFDRYAELLATHLNVERMEPILDEMIAEMEPEMPRHIAKWGKPEDMGAWRRSVEVMREQMYDRRADVLRQLKEEFGMSEEKLQEYLQRYE